MTPGPNELKAANAEQALTIYEQIEDPKAAQVRARLAAWREQTRETYFFTARRRKPCD